jgi:hypothetical protein
VPDSDTSLWAKDVQRLLWAAGEARRRRRPLKRPTVHRRLADLPMPIGDGDYFTEWQPATS